MKDPAKLKIFPFDCKGCKYYIRYDLSVDDYTNICKADNIFVDDCDANIRWDFCHKGYTKNWLIDFIKFAKDQGFIFALKYKLGIAKEGKDFY